MDKKKLPLSKNFEDHTGYTGKDRLLDKLFTLLNPVYAYRNLRGSMIDNGMIAPLMDRKMPESKNFEDRTGIPKTPDLMRRMLFEQYKSVLPPGELLKQQDYRYMQVDPILNIAHDPFRSKTRK